MTGTLDLVQRGYTGLSVEEGMLRFDPALPEEIDRLALQLYYRGHHLEVVLDHDRLRVAAPASHLPPVRIGCDGHTDVLHAGDSVEFHLDPDGDRLARLTDPETDPLRA